MDDYDSSVGFGATDEPDTLPEAHPHPEGAAEEQAIDREDQCGRSKSRLELWHEIEKMADSHFNRARSITDLDADTLTSDVMDIVWPQISNARTDQEKILHRMKNLIYVCSSWKQVCESSSANLDQAVSMLEDIVKRTTPPSVWG